MYKILFNLIWVASFLFSIQLNGQQYTVRGAVVDAVTLQPLIGANLFVVGKENQGTSTDIDGNFLLDNLSLGQHQLSTSYLGYQTLLTPIEVKSGKELVLRITLNENTNQLNEVVVTAQNDKGKTVNTMAYASTRTFSVEESNKYAGAVDDPLRMVQAFAGVVAVEDGNNHISIRGNSPNGLLWRMEGVDIPNPNHYADPSSSGGGVSALSAQMLSNSDFSTGAFAAEYGNAMSGVFDLKLRKGNNKKREYTFKAGFLGLEGSAEGPFSKTYNGSYLINYRYSTLSIIDKLGVELAGVLNYSDLAYTINLPTKKIGTFSLFGLHGVSSQNIEDELDTTTVNIISQNNNGFFESNMSVDGIKHMAFVGKDAYINTTIAYATSKNVINSDFETQYTTGTYFEKYNSSAKNDKITATSNLTYKLNKNIVLRTGAIYDLLSYNIKYDNFLENNPEPINLANNSDKASLFQAYGQTQIDIGKGWTSNIGVHFIHFLLNGSQSIEPRLNIKKELTAKSNLSLSYGLHSQINPLPVYFSKSDSNEGQLTNHELDLSKANHLILTYQYDLNPHMRLRSEVYYQSLFDLPVGTGNNSKDALMNYRYGYPNYALTNDGKGKNVGVEVTLERFMYKNFYYLLTGSISDSKYKTATSDWLNTRYNTQYSTIGTLGKEWKVGKQGQNNISVNLKGTYIGGQYITPIDLENSIQNGEEVLHEIPFTEKVNDFFKLDVGVKYRRNHKKYTSTLSLDLLNATNRKNVGGYDYNIGSQKVEVWYQAPLIPVLAYKIEF